MHASRRAARRSDQTGRCRGGGRGRLTSGVFRHPLHAGRQAQDVEVVAVEGGALCLPEVSAAGRAVLLVTRLVPAGPPDAGGRDACNHSCASATGPCGGRCIHQPATIYLFVGAYALAIVNSAPMSFSWTLKYFHVISIAINALNYDDI